MSDLKKAAILHTVLIGIIAAMVVSYYPYLPENVASHFGAGGVANGWMSKKGFAAFSIVFPIVIATIMLAVQASISMMARMPASMINFPNKKYWLAPERKDESLAFVIPRVSRFMLVVGAATIGLLAVVTVQAMRANLQPEPRLTGFWPVLAVYLVLVVGGSIRMTLAINRKFGRVPPHEMTDTDAGAPRRYWFAAKTYGWGWGLPATWEGWLFMLLWMPTAIGGTCWLASRPGNIAIAYGFLGLMLAVLLTACFMKGEPPRWRWGNKH